MGDLARLARLVQAAKCPEGFTRYRDDPVGLCRNVLGFEPWSGQQTILETLAQHDAVAVPSGRAIGKSRIGASAGLWFLLTRAPEARVILTAPTAKQVHEVLWAEVRKLYAEAARLKQPLGGRCAKRASTGLRYEDMREMFGMTAETPEAFAGIRAPEMLVIADEASGCEDDIFVAIDGNLAGGGKLLLLGNPTKPRGYFREACREDSRFEVITISSLMSPNIQAGRMVVKGLATTEWLEERRQEWGEDSADYKIHVLGQFVEETEGRLFSAGLLAEAERRWEETPATGRLVIGVDPAGANAEGDESAFATRRGKKILTLHTRRGLAATGHVTEVLGLIKDHRGDSKQAPLVIVDRDGDVGNQVYGALRSYHGDHSTPTHEPYALLGIFGGHRAVRVPLNIDRRRDEVWIACHEAMRDGLAIPTDVKLIRELSEFRKFEHVSGRSKVTSKDALRKALGRSPDRAEAVSLAAWEPIEMTGAATSSEVGRYGEAPPAEQVFDPYSQMGAYDAAKTWEE